MNHRVVSKEVSKIIVEATIQLCAANDQLKRFRVQRNKAYKRIHDALEGKTGK